jgi:hypothetical protein
MANGVVMMPDDGLCRNADRTKRKEGLRQKLDATFRVVETTRNMSLQIKMSDDDLARLLENKPLFEIAAGDLISEGIHFSLPPEA